MNRKKFREYHLEVVQALKAIGNPALGKAIQQDRGSHLKHLGIRFPDLRRRIKKGFSFYHLPEDDVLQVWDTLWNTSHYGDVLFAALEYYSPIVRKKVNPSLWPVLRQWSERVDNWCHSDGLSAIYSRILETYPKEVYPQLISWNKSESEWLRRISLVSLIYYSGKNAVFLPPKKVLPLVSTCLNDQRYYIQTAIGWVLREMGNIHPIEISNYLEDNADKLSTPAFSRAIEKYNSKERKHFQKKRKLHLLTQHQ